MCGRARRTRFCSSCGEEQLRPNDLTVRFLAAQFAKGVSSIDGKLLRSLRSLLTAPGALTTSYVRGERRRLLGPLALFFIANALFVGVQALTQTNPLSSPLASHLRAQDWSALAGKLVGQRLASRGGTLADLAPAFDQAAIFNAKALIILMVLALVPILSAIFYRERRPAGVHIVFALHLYAFILTFLCLALLLAESEHLAGGGGLQSPAVDLALSLFNLAVVAAYTYLAVGRAYGTRGVTRVAEAAIVTAAVGVLFVGYRFVIFLITLYTT